MKSRSGAVNSPPKVRRPREKSRRWPTTLRRPRRISKAPSRLDRALPSQLSLMATQEKRTARLDEIEASFEIIEAICLIANLNAGKGQMDITLSVDGDNSGRVKISWK